MSRDRAHRHRIHQIRPIIRIIHGNQVQPVSRPHLDRSRLKVPAKDLHRESLGRVHDLIQSPHHNRNQHQDLNLVQAHRQAKIMKSR